MVRTHRIMNQFAAQMAITKVANGWILELPKKNDMAAAYGELMNAVPGAIKKMRDSDDVMQRLQEPEEYLPLMPSIPMDTEILVFASFKEMMAYINLNCNEE
jgi:hypothetical protein